MIRCRDIKTGEICEVKEREIWIDLEVPTKEELLVMKRFPINQLALDDAQEIGHWSRFEQYPAHQLLILRTLETPHTSKSRTERVSYFFFPEKEVLITYRNEHVQYIDDAWSNFRGGSAIWVWQKMVDRGVETFFNYLEILGDRLEELEEAAFENQSSNKLPKQVFESRREVLRTRKLTSQARESLLHLERLPSLGAEAYLFRDLTDRMGRVYEGLDSGRDELSNILEVHLSSQNNQLNKIVQNLTVISVLFLPMTLWVGIYGTNVKLHEYLWPEPLSAIFLWGGLILIGASLAIWMRRKGWW